MNPILKRTLTGLGVGALVIGLFLYCPLRAILPIVVVLSTLVQLEFYQLAKRYEPVTGFGLAMGLLWLVAVGLLGFGRGLLALTVYLPMGLVLSGFLLCTWVTFRAKYAHPISTVCSTLFGFLYVPFLLGFFLLTIQLGGDGFWGGSNVEWTRHGLYTLFAIIAIAKFSDTGGFAFGMAFGRHKMCPSISPKKSWEGLCGSMLFSAATAAVFLTFAQKFGWDADIGLWTRLNYPIACAGGALMALLATAGDLIESRFKRECCVKDSATFMPAGMGGFLDMFDSILFLPALVYLPLLLTVL